ncbi:organoarsenical effux MFS transporter ArsJ [Algicola sagamiensis]|uniref:organoarsenical effux MFS transporter ArsJ n=1 Tax=Algicola sagamiensis TaxID=163869 RepID=UPI0003609CB4|nr:organoarsenical effux MFS transporter ArsJ [Algicola sagamiensis]
MFDISLNPSQTKQYLLVTGNYWAFTVTDGALRMLIVLYFFQLGYSPLTIASLFLFYEFFGVVTNLVGGWLAAKFGLNRTMNFGLCLQIIALSMLALPTEYLTVPFVMFAQSLSGVAKDLNKVSAKSSIKLLLNTKQECRVFKMVAILTGSKNALKGIGFFIGGLLLSAVGFQYSLMILSGFIACIFIGSSFLLTEEIGTAKEKVKFREMFSKSDNVNTLSAARLFLFGARDVWFVVALPVFLGSQFGWDHWQVGAFLACWIISYGFFQSIAPRLTGAEDDEPIGRRSAVHWCVLLTLVTAVTATLLHFNIAPQYSILIGLMVYCVVFAVNSSMHSYLIVSYAKDDGVSTDIGFYYMANAMGRLIGTVLSGWLFQMQGLTMCLLTSVIFLVFTTAISLNLPEEYEHLPSSHTS